MLMGRAAGRPVDPSNCSRIIRKFVQWPSRPSNQLAAAVGALAGEDALGASTTERALKRANQRIAGIRRKILVATFAAGA
jgi:hypothetical protein